MLPQRDKETRDWVIRVGLASCGIAAGGQQVYDTLKTKLKERGLAIEVKQTGCMGLWVP